jgi:RNA polymerase sigma-70 factor (ECF subfamily)
MTDSESSALLERFRARDEGALADLYNLMGSRAYGLAFRILRDGAAAEDVVQNAFTTLWEQSDRLDEARGSIQGLLLTIVHRRAVDAARSRQRQSSHVGPLEVDPVDGDLTPLDAVVAGDEAQSRAREVQAALAVLPESQRQVVLLAYFEARSQQDIAALLDVPLGTVKSRLRLAMARLRHELGTAELGTTEQREQAAGVMDSTPNPARSTDEASDD